MLTIRRDAQIHREEADGPALRFHFSFKDYQDPAFDGFGAWRLFNDDCESGVLANRMHPHAELEVVTYIVEGTFRHEDSRERWRRIAGLSGCEDTCVTIHQQVHLYAAASMAGVRLDDNQRDAVEFACVSAPGRLSSRTAVSPGWEDEKARHKERRRGRFGHRGAAPRAAACPPP
jgi:hypothetical protein